MYDLMQIQGEFVIFKDNEAIMTFEEEYGFVAHTIFRLLANIEEDCE